MSIDLEALRTRYSPPLCDVCNGPTEFEESGSYSDSGHDYYRCIGDCRTCRPKAKNDADDADVLALIDECVTLRAQLAEANDGVEAGRRAAAAAKELTAALL